MSGTQLYPWEKLKNPGDAFDWKDPNAERSLRAQASKQAKRRGIIITVRTFWPYRMEVKYVRNVL